MNQGAPRQFAEHERSAPERTTPMREAPQGRIGRQAERAPMHEAAHQGGGEPHHGGNRGGERGGERER